jgi:hypothetical protein
MFVSPNTALNAIHRTDRQGGAVCLCAAVLGNGKKSKKQLLP